MEGIEKLKRNRYAITIVDIEIKTSTNTKKKILFALVGLKRDSKNIRF